MPRQLRHRLRRGVGRALGMAALLCLAACSLTPAQPPVALEFDLGPVPSAALPTAPATAGNPGPGAPTAPADTGVPPIRLQGCSAPLWLDSTAMRYRLLWRDPLQVLAFRDSRWVAPPCALLGQRLRELLPVGSGQARILTIAVDDFSQQFASANDSSVHVRLHAALAVGPDPAPLRERMFERSAPAPHADAAAGAQALAAATDALLAELRDWASQP